MLFPLVKSGWAVFGGAARSYLRDQLTSAALASQFLGEWLAGESKRVGLPGRRERQCKANRRSHTGRRSEEDTCRVHSDPRRVNPRIFAAPSRLAGLPRRLPQGKRHGVCRRSSMRVSSVVSGRGVTSAVTVSPGKAPQPGPRVVRSHRIPTFSQGPLMSLGPGADSNPYSLQQSETDHLATLPFPG